jgi:hydrogenase maturation protease
MTDAAELLILGLGNVLFGDDGLGVIAVALLTERYEMPDGVCAADGGTLGLSLLPLLQQSRRALLVDAIRCPGAAPGSLVRLDGADVGPAVRERLSPHQVGVADLLDAARLLGGNPAEVTLIGLVPDMMEWSVGRSKAVSDSMELLIEAIAHEVESLGYPMLDRPQAGAGPRPDHTLVRHFGM